MYTRENLLKMLSSEKASTRYDACEWIRVSQESSPDIVSALEKATHDEGMDVAEWARLALQADAHHKQAIQLGFAKPGDIVPKIEQVNQLPQGETMSKNQAVNLNEDRSFALLRIGQAITFIACIVILISLWDSGKGINTYNGQVRFLFGVYMAYIGMQVYAILKYGFNNSFTFLKVLGNILVMLFTSSRR